MPGGPRRDLFRLSRGRANIIILVVLGGRRDAQHWRANCRLFCLLGGGRETLARLGSLDPRHVPVGPVVPVSAHAVVHLLGDVHRVIAPHVIEGRSIGVQRLVPCLGAGVARRVARDGVSRRRGSARRGDERRSPSRRGWGRPRRSRLLERRDVQLCRSDLDGGDGLQSRRPSQRRHVPRQLP
jgi:hypothetical protein